MEEVREVKCVLQQSPVLGALHPRLDGDGARYEAAQVEQRVLGSVPLVEPALWRLSAKTRKQCDPILIQNIYWVL